MAYYLVYPSNTEQDQKVQIIRQWLFAEIDKFKKTGIQSCQSSLLPVK